VDDKGRLNTPSAALEYFEAHGVDQFLCTTLDGRIALIYPLQVWLQHIEKMAAMPGKAPAAKRLAFLGNSNGAEVKLDKTGRILLPSNLIETAGKHARLELKQYSAELALKLAEERVRARMDASAESGLVDSFVAELGRQGSNN
jgi:hypothetical protein